MKYDIDILYFLDVFVLSQRRIQHPSNHLRWSFMKKQLTAESR